MICDSDHVGAVLQMKSEKTNTVTDLRNSEWRPEGEFSERILMFDTNFRSCGEKDRFE